MSVYMLGSRCGKFIKFGFTDEPSPNGRRLAAAKGYYGVKYPYLLAYVATVGDNDEDAESKLLQHFSQSATDKTEYGKESRYAVDVLPYVAWLRLQWFCETDPEGKAVPDAVDYEAFRPTVERVSTDYREEDLTSPLEAEYNPFWFLPDTTVEPDEDFFTPAEFIEPVRVALGGRIDLDVASHPKANRTIRAIRYFTKSTNGLEQPWHGRVWLSPRTKDMDAWTKKALHELHAGRVSDLICLIGTRAEASNYFKPLLSMAASVCIVTGGGPTFDGKGALTANNSNDRWHFVYFGDNAERFIGAMKHLGVCFKAA